MRRGGGVFAGALLLVAACGGESLGGGSAGERLSPRQVAEQEVRALIACMEGRGWNPIYNDDDGLPSLEFIDVPQEQGARMDADMAACRGELGLNEPPGEFSDGQLTEFYEHELATAECLRNLGVDVPEAPSEQVFKDRYSAGDPWGAYEYVGQVNREMWIRYNQECPQSAGD